MLHLTCWLVDRIWDIFIKLYIIFQPNNQTNFYWKSINFNQTNIYWKYISFNVLGTKIFFTLNPTNDLEHVQYS